jgi:hypothetical protein
MKLVLSRLVRRLTLVVALTTLGVVALSTLSGMVFAQQDTPAADCDSGPNVVCPSVDDPSAEYIASVTAVPDGVVILLTEAGLEKARECGGAAEIAAMSKAIYDTIPDDQKSAFQLDWTSRVLADEIYGHAFFNQPGGMPGLGSIYEGSNPINIVFADYGGPGEMTTKAGIEQSVFTALGAVHRAAC